MSYMRTPYSIRFRRKISDTSVCFPILLTFEMQMYVLFNKTIESILSRESINLKQWILVKKECRLNSLHGVRYNNN